ncbi:hypothetical protein [Nonomuraea wenchangensis]|uniref:Uncharacterized protein n=1 Tax=Nonomuraea wenchangensis TaxID=568860 RepID=A0A1I0H8U5_9ACTN|nr:hypothetical protein [Nonomuraea wenchangensis]SET80204.1 hypothetical protein SAMN05421811_104191 [Nonomuraea wenchangensis]
MDANGIDAAPGYRAALAVADAVLYEGYLLYPYRRSSPKNQVRWQFGVLLPEPWARAHGLEGGGVAGSTESWWQQTECLLVAPADAVVRGRLRFLQLRRRTPEERLPDGGHREADRVGEALSFDEAVPRELDVRASVAELRSGEKRLDLGVPGGETVTPLPGSAGRTRWREWPLSARVTLSLKPCEAPAAPLPKGETLFRLRVRTENAGQEPSSPETPREEALQHALIACHTLLTVPGGRFVSLLEPPDWARDAAGACVNAHTYPVLSGDQVVLSSPILLYDNPRIAPESPGDLHDAAEIDEILSLRTLTLTDAEKREARATDPRAAAILDRVEAMTPEDLARLHGTNRDPRPAGPVPWWHPEADASVSPDTDAVEVAGTLVRKGSRVRLRPRLRGSDPQDMFLDGRTALVEAVLLDVDGARHLAVTLEDDPAAELNQWYGRYRYFAPEETEPLDGPLDEPLDGEPV